MHEVAARQIYAEGAYCGCCEYLGWLTCTECREVCLRYARAAMHVFFGEQFSTELAAMIYAAGRAEGTCFAVADSLRQEADAIGMNDPRTADFLNTQADRLTLPDPGGAGMVTT